jgi:hypothetical protein
MKKLSLSIAGAIIVISLIIGGIYGGMKDWSKASPPETVHNEISNTDMSALMASMSIQQPQKPLTPPDFNLLSVAEEEIKLSDHRGKVVLLSFWTTW